MKGAIIPPSPFNLLLVAVSDLNVFLQRLVQERRGGNLLISPLGVDLLLATLLEGARGEDREHLAHLLGLDQLDGFPYCDIKIAYQQSLKNIVSEQSMVNMFYYKSHVIQGTSLVRRSA